MNPKLRYQVREFSNAMINQLKFWLCWFDPSEIRIPLEWRDFEHSKRKLGKSDFILLMYC